MNGKGVAKRVPVGPCAVSISSADPLQTAGMSFSCKTRCRYRIPTKPATEARSFAGS
jgi:hypothetical protein